MIDIAESFDPEIERLLLQILSDSTLLLPINSIQLIEKINLRRFKPISSNTLSYFLQKFATQSYIRYLVILFHSSLFTYEKNIRLKKTSFFTALRKQ